MSISLNKEIFSNFDNDFGIKELVASYNEKLPSVGTTDNLDELVAAYKKNGNSWKDKTTLKNLTTDAKGKVNSVIDLETASVCCFLYKLAYIADKLNRQNKRNGIVNFSIDPQKLSNQIKNPSIGVSQDIKSIQLFKDLQDEKSMFDKLLALCFVHVTKDILDKYDTNADPAYYMSFDDAGALKFHSSNGLSVLNLADVCNLDECKNLYLMAHLNSREFMNPDNAEKLIKSIKDYNTNSSDKLNYNKYFARLFLQFIGYKLSVVGTVGKYYKYLEFKKEEYKENDSVLHFLINEVEKSTSQITFDVLKQFIDQCVHTANESLLESKTPNNKDGRIFSITPDQGYRFPQLSHHILNIQTGGSPVDDLIDRLNKQLSEKNYILSEKSKQNITKRYTKAAAIKNTEDFTRSIVYAVITATNLNKVIENDLTNRATPNGKIVLSDQEVNALLEHYKNLGDKSNEILKSINKRVDQIFNSQLLSR